MNDNCKIIMDLLPLYVENMTSEETNNFIETHIENCPECKIEIEKLKSDVVVVEEELDAMPIKFIKNELKRDRRSLALIVLLSFISLSIISIFFLTKPNYVKYSNGLIKLESSDDYVTIKTTKPVGNMEISKFESEPGSETYDYFITLYDTKLNDILNNKKIYLESIEKESLKYLYYSENMDKVAIPLRGPTSGGAMILPRLAMNMYMRLAIALIIFLTLASFVFYLSTMKKIILVGFPFAFVLSIFSIYGFKGAATYHLVRDFIYVMLLALSYYLIFIVIGLILNRRKKY